MMASLLWLTVTLLVLHEAHSYILLTANMDDVQAIAKQMLSAPVVNQIGRIWRRATTQFNQRLQQPGVHMRADDDLESDRDDTDESNSKEIRIRSRRILKELAELGKNATNYFKSLRRVFVNYINE